MQGLQKLLLSRERGLREKSGQVVVAVELSLGRSRAKWQKSGKVKREVNLGG